MEAIINSKITRRRDSSFFAIMGIIGCLCLAAIHILYLSQEMAVELSHELVFMLYGIAFVFLSLWFLGAFFKAKVHPLLSLDLIGGIGFILFYLWGLVSLGF